MQQLDMYTQLLIQHQDNDRRAKLARRMLVREALANRPRRSVYEPLLVGIGKRLVIWGTHLQRRYDDLASGSASATASTSMPEMRRETTWAIQNE